MWSGDSRSKAQVRVSGKCSRCRVVIWVPKFRVNGLNYCPDCRREVRRARGNAYYHMVKAEGGIPRQDKRCAEQRAAGRNQGHITVLYDPCDAPLAVGAVLSHDELDSGIRFGSFVSGMTFRLADGRVVVLDGDALK